MVSKRISLLTLLFFSSVASAQSVPDKYFGYFGGDYPPAPGTSVGDGLAEMKDHINLFSMQAWSGFTTPEARADNQARVLSLLAQAKAAHVHAMVPAHPFVFQAVRDSNTGNITCWNNDPTAAASWASLSQAMVDGGYLIPGDPARSTVVAVYIVDEPNDKARCLADSQGQANPSFVNAVSAVRQDPRTALLPIASILSRNSDNFEEGVKLLDWVGFDYYPDDGARWLSDFASFKAAVPGKKYIVVPGARESCGGDVENNDPAAFLSAMNNDPSVVWMAPFMWISGDPPCKGVRDLPNRRATYTQEGISIRNAQCSRSQADQSFCKGGADVGAALNLLLD